MLVNMGRSKGFTLIEVMIVVVIVSVLLAIGLPAYQEQVRKTKRSIARGELLEVLARQEQYFINNKTYAEYLVKLGYSDAVSNEYAVDDDTNSGAPGSGIYNIKLVPLPNATLPVLTFRLEADPTGSQSKDNLCKKLTINQAGIKGENGTGEVSDCW